MSYQDLSPRFETPWDRFLYLSYGVEQQPQLEVELLVDEMDAHAGDGRDVRIRPINPELAIRHSGPMF